MATVTNRYGGITRRQAKSARLLLGWGRMRVCRLLGISLHTLEAAVSTQSSHFMSDLTATKLRKLYEDASIAFSVDDSDSARKQDADAKCSDKAE